MTKPRSPCRLFNAVWEAENDNRDVDFHLRSALDHFDKASKTLSPSDTWATMQFLAAELLRRLGDFAAASGRLDQLEAGVKANGLTFPPDLIAQQRELIGKQVRTRKSGDEIDGRLRRRDPPASSGAPRLGQSTNEGRIPATVIEAPYACVATMTGLTCISAPLLDRAGSMVKR